MILENEINDRAHYALVPVPGTELCEETRGGQPARVSSCPFCQDTHALGKCPHAAGGGPWDELTRLRALCNDALDVINGLQKRLSDRGLLGISEDLNGFYNGTGVDGKNVQVCMRLLEARHG